MGTELWKTCAQLAPPLPANLGLLTTTTPPVLVNPRSKLDQANRLLRGKPIGGMRPAAPRAARHGERSVSVRTRPLSPPSAQLSPSASENATESDRPPSR